MVFKRNVSMTIAGRVALALLLLTLAAWPVAAEETPPPAAPVLEIGASWSGEVVAFSRYFIASFEPFETTLSLRWVDLLETSLRIHVPIGENLSGPPFVGFEVLLAPALGAWRPAIGLGLFYGTVFTFYSPVPIIEGDLSVYAVVAPLRWSYRITTPPELLPRNQYLVFSFLELRYGSLVPSGGLPAFERLGGFYISIVIGSFGFYGTLL
jgi:hypothetical protein